MLTLEIGYEQALYEMLVSEHYNKILTLPRVDYIKLKNYILQENNEEALRHLEELQDRIVDKTIDELLEELKPNTHELGI